MLCFRFLPLVICSCFAIIPFCLAVGIVAVTLAAGMPNEVFSATHTSQNGALRKHIVHVDICRRSNVCNHTGKGIPRNIEHRMYLCSHLCFFVAGRRTGGRHSVMNRLKPHWVAWALSGADAPAAIALAWQRHGGRGRLKRKILHNGGFILTA